jgi:hypothetical protein
MRRHPHDRQVSQIRGSAGRPAVAKTAGSGDPRRTERGFVRGTAREPLLADGTKDTGRLGIERQN